MSKTEVIGYQQDGPMDQWGAKLQMQSAGATPEQGAAPLVGTGEMVVRPLLHILLCDGKVRGWTDNREWAEQWANQYYLRSFVSGVSYVRPHNT